MSGNSIKTKPIVVKKIFHRGEDRIGLFFDYDRETISIIKKLPQCTYSNTRKCWYLPYTQKSYEHFKALSVPYTLEKTSERRTQEAAKNLDKTPIATKVAPPSVKEKDGGNPEADLVSKQKRKIDVLLQGKHFIISLPYNKDDVAIIKKLTKAYWNEKEKKWLCLASINNALDLQNTFNVWDEKQDDWRAFQKYLTNKYPKEYATALDLYIDKLVLERYSKNTMRNNKKTSEAPLRILVCKTKIPTKMEFYRDIT